jgi:murein DD-endopeptidase MepM/ murein hydrolase activator NlpD
MMIFQLLFGRKHRELKIVLVTLGFLMALPMLAVAVIASSGVAAVSAAIATFNPLTHEVTIYGPGGDVKDTITLSTIWPTTGIVSDEFGAHEQFRQELNIGTHTGIDIANGFGIPIYAFLEGNVIQVDPSGGGSCGIFVRLQHIDGVSSLYCHMEHADVSVGEVIKQGQQIGLMGSTGASTGPHLHFQISVNGVPVNPRTFVSGEPPRGP